MTRERIENKRNEWNNVSTRKKKVWVRKTTTEQESNVENNGSKINANVEDHMVENMDRNMDDVINVDSSGRVHQNNGTVDQSNVVKDNCSTDQAARNLKKGKQIIDVNENIIEEINLHNAFSALDDMSGFEIPPDSNIDAPNLGASSSTSHPNTSDSFSFNVHPNSSTNIDLNSSLSSPYAHLSTPPHITLPPPLKVTDGKSSLNSIGINSHSSKKMKRGRKKKLHASENTTLDDLNDGIDFSLNDIQPSGSNKMPTNRHNGKHSTPLSSPLVINDA